MKSTTYFLFVTSFLGSVAAAHAQMKMMSDNDLMADLKGSAPANVLEHATILNMGADGKMKPIQEATNGWTSSD